MDINYMSMQSNAINYSKKHLRELIQLKLTNSLDEFQLSGKKFDKQLKKASKVFAAIVAKENRKQKKVQEC
jgi:hypothetical protein